MAELEKRELELARTKLRLQGKEVRRRPQDYEAHVVAEVQQTKQNAPNTETS